MRCGDSERAQNKRYSKWDRVTGGEELQAPCLAASEEDLPGYLPDLTRDPPEAGNHLDPLVEAWLKGVCTLQWFPSPHLWITGRQWTGSRKR